MNGKSFTKTTKQTDKTKLSNDDWELPDDWKTLELPDDWKINNETKK